MRGLPPGIGTQLELGIRFAAWRARLFRHPTWREVSTAFQVSRATAYRWLAAYDAAQQALECGRAVEYTGEQQV